jgi:hypothetical protein
MNNNLSIFSLNKFRKPSANSYNSKDECIKHKTKYGVLSNPRFPLFDQNYFHAGDMKDIQKYGLLPLRYVYSDEKLNKGTKETLFKLYKNIDYNSVLNSFEYMFKKFKKGIFVIIKNNKLIVYLPFSNANYKNTWYKQTYFSEEEKRLLQTHDLKTIKKQLDHNIIDFQKKYPEQFRKHKIDFNREKWYANNCNLRNQYPPYEGELNTSVFKNMIEELLKDRTIHDVEFFINDRDFPILKNDYTEPFNHLYDGENVKIEPEYQYKKMAPIFSKSITDKFADMLIPTNDDWLMASNNFFVDGCADSYHSSVWKNINQIWSKKKNICIFRGSATGCGITIQNNNRLKAANISIDYPKILDAGITDWNARPKKYNDLPIQIIDTKEFRFKIAEKITNTEKSNYKYILNIDGHVSAFRLSSELSMKSVILLVKSSYKMWFSHLLEEYVHYVPIKDDLEDLISQIKWCIDNDKKCKIIAENAKKFFDKYLTKDGIFNYLQEQFNLIYNNKNFKNLLDIAKLKDSKKNIAIISCFRDKGDGVREKENKLFVQLMNKLCNPYCNFHIYIIEQSNDGENFNIGKLKNIGFIIANLKDKYDNFIFSDIDTIPDYDLMKYFIKPYKYPVSLASCGTRYQNKNKIINKPFIGALVSFSKELFKKINGYPNNFWGWGGEDDALLNRLILNKDKYLYYPKKGCIIDNEEVNNTTISIKNKVQSTKVDKVKYEKLYDDLKSWNKNGINNLNYKILSTNKINENTTQIKVDLLKKVDEKIFSFLFPEPNPNWEIISKPVKNMWKSIVIKYV